MKIKVKAPNKLEDGIHQGVIEKVEYRETPHQYTDVCIKVGDLLLKVGFPTAITPDSRLGKLLLRFGQMLVIGEDVDPEMCLIGKTCTFQSITETTPKGSFPKVIAESLKPIPEEKVQ